MRLAPYRAVLGLPGMRLFTVISLIARIPSTTTATALTLSVVLDRHKGYGAAGLVTGGFTIGLAIGSPLLGRVVDRRGPRPVLLVTGVAAVLFWNSAPWLAFPALVPVAVIGGLFHVPVMGLVRQSIAARVPAQHRRQAYSLDSMAVELSFMIGPALAVLAITQAASAAATLHAVGFALGAAAAVMYAYNPQTVSLEPGAPAAPGPPARPDWLAPRFLLVLGVGASAALVLAGTDVSIIAVLRAHGQTQWAGLTIMVWCAASLVGGFVHGALPRPLTMLTLMALLGAATIPAGIAHDWRLLALALIPAGLACAPTLAATVDAVSRAVPESARGEAIGRHSAALTIGNAIGAPLAGVVIDHSSPALGFAAVGSAGAGLALTAWAVAAVRRTRRRALGVA